MRFPGGTKGALYLRPFPWQKREERAASTHFAIDAHASALRLNDAFCKGETQAGALKLLGDPSVELMELLEEMLLVGRRDPDSCILHFEPEEPVRLGDHSHCDS